MATDRVGLGWRPELAAGTLAHLDRIDLLEVVADDWFEASRSERQALRTLARQAPVALHGVGLGLASREPVEARRLEALARLVGEVEPELWSEHLAFVRGGGREIGHLAAPPRCAATIAAAARNLERARRVVGAWPAVENVATLVDPPGSVLDEGAWLAGVLAASPASLLLDLHNLHANAVNFAFPAGRVLDSLPLERVALVHVAGGRWLRAPAGHGGARRLLDDHLHAVPLAVHELLEELAARAPRPLTVVLERDGAFGPIEELLDELELLREALRRGRARAAARPAPPRRAAPPGAADPPLHESALARLYSDPALAELALADPAAAARALGLGARGVAALQGLDRAGLALASASYARKRETVARLRAAQRARRQPLARLRRWSAEGLCSVVRRLGASFSGPPAPVPGWRR